MLSQDNKNHGKSTAQQLLSTQKINKKFLYIGILVLSLLIICLSTKDTTMMIDVFFQYHEPSIRIFRSLIEIALLFLCTAISIRVYVHFLSYHMVQPLLFQSIHAENHQYNTNNEPVVDRNYDHDLFQPINDNNTPLDDKNDDDDDKTKKNDDNNDENDDEPASGTAADTTSLHHYSTVILSMACDLFIYIGMTLIFYVLSAIQTFPQPSFTSSSSSSSTTTWKDSTTHDLPSSSSSSLSPPPSLTLWMAQVAAPTFPLLLFLFLILRCIRYYHQYQEFYIVLSYTLYAPFYNVTFRDGMIGDILTSMVRPMQDVAFTVCYILFGLRGYWSDHQQDYYEYVPHVVSTVPGTTSSSMTTSNLISNSANITASLGNDWFQSADAYVPSMERSWIVHTAILPACMISPLWWRFLQTIRQSYDVEQRWPYLGNAMKYFLAAQVAMLGVYHPSVRQSAVWICSFILATLYQIYWDVFMDWGLLVHNRKTSMWNLRSQRLYPRKSFYWIMLIVNTVLRFCWTLSFVPFHYLSASGVLTNNFSSEAWANVLILTIASAEIIRRTLWALIRVEWEVIKVKNEMSNDRDDNVHHEVEMTPMKVIDATESWGDEIQRSLNRYKVPFTSDMSSLKKTQIYGELCLYTTTFAVLGLIIAAHRGTL